MKRLFIICFILILFGCSQQKSASLFNAFGNQISEEKFDEIRIILTDHRRKSNYQTLKAINEDYIGIVRIGNLIEEKVVHSSDNEEYLRLDFEKNYYRKGTVFMDYRNTLDDQNIILYGHYVYYDESAMFSPLHLLKDSQNYEVNKFIEFELEDETRIYQIAAVFYYDLYAVKPQYFHVNYDDLESYLKDVKEAVLYDTEVEITADSKLLSLQTCVRNRDDLRLIVVAKQIER